MNEIVINKVKMLKSKPFCAVNTADEEFTLNNDLIYKYRIEKGRRFSIDEFETILYENNLMNAKKAAYEFASYSPRSEKKVIQKLEKMKYSEDIINICIDFLYEYELLNDEEYAKKYINDFLLTKKGGRKKIINKLIQNGIDISLATNTVEEIVDDNIEIQMIKHLMEKNSKFGRVDNMKRISMLINRGFNIDNISEVLNNCKNSN